MKQAEKAKFFDVSLTTLANWKRQGCPVNDDVAVITEWRTRRKLSQEGLDAIFPELPKLAGEFVKRLADVGRRIAEVNSWPPGTNKTPNLLKVSTLMALYLERTLLQLPGRVLVEAKPGTLPEDIHRIVLAALDESRAEGDAR